MNVSHGAYLVGTICQLVAGSCNPGRNAMPSDHSCVLKCQFCSRVAKISRRLLTAPFGVEAEFRFKISYLRIANFWGPDAAPAYQDAQILTIDRARSHDIHIAPPIRSRISRRFPESMQTSKSKITAAEQICVE
jgi:hypothetical protein